VFELAAQFDILATNVDFLLGVGAGNVFGPQARNVGYKRDQEIAIKVKD